MGSQRHTPAALAPAKRSGTHCAEDCVGPRAGLVGCGKSRPPTGSDPRTVQPVASHCSCERVALGTMQKDGCDLTVICLNTLRTDDADLRFYITVVQDG